MCRACSRAPKRSTGGVYRVPDLADIKTACREGQKKGAPHWLAAPKRLTLESLAPLPAWVTQQRAHCGNRWSKGGEWVSAGTPLTVPVVPLMSTATLRAELGRQARRLAGHDDAEQWQEVAQ